MLQFSSFNPCNFSSIQILTRPSCIVQSLNYTSIITFYIFFWKTKFVYVVRMGLLDSKQTNKWKLKVECKLNGSYQIFLWVWYRAVRLTAWWRYRLGYIWLHLTWPLFLLRSNSNQTQLTHIYTFNSSPNLFVFIVWNKTTNIINMSLRIYAVLLKITNVEVGVPVIGFLCFTIIAADVVLLSRHRTVIKIISIYFWRDIPNRIMLFPVLRVKINAQKYFYKPHSSAHTVATTTTSAFWFTARVNVRISS